MPSWIDSNSAVAEYIETATEHAAICLLWQASDASENGGNGFPISEDDLPWVFINHLLDNVPYIGEATTAFVRDNYYLLLHSGITAEQCGHDLILTANQHGTGFWDRGTGWLGDALTTATKGYSFEAEFALDDDGEVAWLMVENTPLIDHLGWSVNGVRDDSE